MKRTTAGLVSAVATLVLAAVGVSGAAAGNKPSSYTNATWYSKYQVVASGAVDPSPAPSCTTPIFGGNVDASHETGSQSETFIAIDPSNGGHVVAGENEIQRLPMRANYSFDGGTTFCGVDLPLPPPRTQSGFDFGSDPSLAIDTKGNVYYSYIIVDFSGGGSVNGTEMALSRSTDGGRTWTATYWDPQTGEGQFNDKPMVTVDNNRKSKFFGRIYVAWDNATGNSKGNDLQVSYSTDGGVTMSDPVAATASLGGGPKGSFGADPYVTSNGTLHVAWLDYQNQRIAEASSTDGGVSYGPVHTIAPTLLRFDTSIPAQNVRGAVVYPSCGAMGATLYCSWGDETIANGFDVFLSKSTDGGVTWSPQRRVTSDTGNADQFNHWLAVDPSNNSVNVAFYDTRQDPTNKTTLYSLARSTDGGSTFSFQTVATAPTDETTPGANLGNQYGDYEGIAARNGIVRPVWTDRRAAVIAAGLREEVFTQALAIP